MSYAGPRFNGPEYDHQKDGIRLSNQIQRIRSLMLDGRWRTLDEIHKRTGDPVASISAQLRHLRKPRFGGYSIDRRLRPGGSRGLYEYRLSEASRKDGAHLNPGATFGAPRKALIQRIEALEKQNSELKGRLMAVGCMFCK